MPLGDRLTSTFLGAKLGKSNLFAGVDSERDLLTGIQAVGRLVNKSGNSVSGGDGRGDWIRTSDLLNPIQEEPVSYLEFRSPYLARPLKPYKVAPSKQGELSGSSPKMSMGSQGQGPDSVLVPRATCEMRHLSATGRDLRGSSTSTKQGEHNLRSTAAHTQAFSCGRAIER